MTEQHRVPVVMCTWNRVSRLPHTLELLAEQDVPASLFVWNNNRRERERVDDVIAASPIPAHVVHCRRNIGSFARFYVARSLAQVRDAVVFIDDDLEFGPSMVAEQLASFAPKTLTGWWAFRYRPGARTYGERDRVDTPFEPAEYVGVGGLVADASIFTEPRLFECPRRYWFVDDMWLSYYAGHVKGWQLRRSRAEYEFASDYHDLDLTLGPTKTRMLRYLKRRGWAVGSSGAPAYGAST